MGLDHDGVQYAIQLSRRARADTGAHGVASILPLSAGRYVDNAKSELI